jgi:hypothetical protein
MTVVAGSAAPRGLQAYPLRLGVARGLLLPFCLSPHAHTCSLALASHRTTHCRLLTVATTDRHSPLPSELGIGAPSSAGLISAGFQPEPHANEPPVFFHCEPSPSTTFFCRPSDPQRP